MSHDELLARAAAAIESGRPIIVPTDTVYGLAVRAGDAEALDHVFALKQRPVERSIAVLVADVAQAQSLVELSDGDVRLATRFWPGALTIVARRHDHVDASIGRSDGTVGVRCPAERWLRELMALVGPLATTSANLSGEDTPADPNDAAAALAGPVDLVVDLGPRGGEASTVARLGAGDELTIFREGPITQADLEAALADDG